MDGLPTRHRMAEPTSFEADFTTSYRYLHFNPFLQHFQPFIKGYLHITEEI